MLPHEQCQFVIDLIDSTRTEIMEAVTTGKTPRDWNGTQLRQYIADKFASQAWKMNRRDRRAYKNAVATIAGLAVCVAAICLNATAGERRGLNRNAAGSRSYSSSNADAIGWTAQQGAYARTALGSYRSRWALHDALQDRKLYEIEREIEFRRHRLELERLRAELRAREAIARVIRGR